MKQRIRWMLWLAAGSLLFTTVPFWLIEKGGNPAVNQYGDAIWWWIVTSTTVGYGDIVPLTTAGRIVAIFAIITGFAVYANTLAIIVESVYQFVERRNLGTHALRLHGHVVICEYTAVADELLQQIDRHPQLVGKEIAIVTDLANRNPYPQHHFVRGVPLNPAVLSNACIKDADIVFIFANLRFSDPDIKTLHTATRIKKLNSRANIFVELLNPDSELAKSVPLEMIVMPARLLMKTILTTGSIDLAPWLNNVPVERPISAD